MTAGAMNSKVVRNRFRPRTSGAVNARIVKARDRGRTDYLEGMR
jgi:hypothetical protein